MPELDHADDHGGDDIDDCTHADDDADELYKHFNLSFDDTAHLDEFIDELDDDGVHNVDGFHRSWDVDNGTDHVDYF